MNSFILLPPYSRRTGTRMPQTPSSFHRQESSPALNRRILPSVDCAFRAAPSGRYSDRRPRFPSESRPSRCFISAHPESCGHRMRTRALKALSSSPGRNLHRRSIAAFSLRSISRFALPGVYQELIHSFAAMQPPHGNENASNAFLVSPAGIFTGAQSPHSPFGRLCVSRCAFGALFRPPAALPFGISPIPVFHFSSPGIIRPPHKNKDA